MLTLHESFSKEALVLSPIFSPAAVKPLSSLFLPPELNILLGKEWFGDATAFSLHFLQVGPDVTFVEITSSVCAQHLDRPTVDITKADSFRKNAQIFLPAVQNSVICMEKQRSGMGSFV